ncbi:NADH-quinone oxidoreductase subunit L [Buchnera aphidicola (Eriosoma grossulariae)]|uniref:NADH-quinone oxidoreductase subunit L n=1 Tax=Buchnera aphidicola TaxID=9 RepID=UPI003464C121
MNIISLIIFSPLLSFFILIFFKKQLSQFLIGVISIGSILLSSLIILYISIDFYMNHFQFYIQKIYYWIHAENIKIHFNFLIDSVSLTMLAMVSSVGLLIHIFSFWYIQFKIDITRFFAYMNLFMASMFILVLADNLLFMFLGWEGVGVCSYCLIGFYYNNQKNYYAATKAFLMTRLGDVFLLIAILILYTHFGTVNFHSLNFLINSQLIQYSFFLPIITIFLLLGAIGKSAQLPFQTWLSSAMVGPTPVSALIHAATMITAGVYLIIRIHYVFLLTPWIFNIIGIIGLLTLIISSFAALVQKDIKKILAYSTMNQISYMFLALSVKSWNIALMHLISHAIFKSLLFLSAGSLILSCNNEKNILKLGGLKNQIPFIYICFLVGGASLIAFPIVTFSFYTKENILFTLLYNHHLFFLIIGLFGNLLTSIYTFRMIFLIFHGSSTTTVQNKTGLLHTFPLFILILFSTVLGVLVFKKLNLVFLEENFECSETLIVTIMSVICSFMGFLISYYIWVKNIFLFDNFIIKRIYNFLHKLFFSGFYFDYFYNFIFNRYYIFITKKLLGDPLGVSLEKITLLSYFLNKFFAILENGYLRWYIFSFMIGLLLFSLSILLV